jgi:hypothetical protein
MYSTNIGMDQGEPGVDYDDANLNPLICDLCKKAFDSLDKLGEHQNKSMICNLQVVHVQSCAF